MDNISSLYHTSLDKIKRTGQNQYIALCPFHKDTNPSFSFNDSTGLYKCFACEKEGNAYKYAVDRDFDNPKQYIIDDNNYTNGTIRPKYHSPTPSNQFLDDIDNTPKEFDASKMEQYTTSLKAIWDTTELSKVWIHSEIADDYHIGVNNKEEYSKWISTTWYKPSDDILNQLEAYLSNEEYYPFNVASISEEVAKIKANNIKTILGENPKYQNLL